MTIVFGETPFGEMVFGDNPISTVRRLFSETVRSVSGAIGSRTVLEINET